jgi:hypothetical protein
MKAYFTILVVAFTTACNTRTEDLRPSEPARALGIEKLNVTETPTTLTVTGLGIEGEVMAKVELKVGRFTFESDERGEVYGRQMVVQSLGKEVAHESEGLNALTLPTRNLSVSIAAFLLDPEVTSALGLWGVRFDSTWIDLGIEATVPAGGDLPAGERAYCTFTLTSDGASLGGCTNIGCSGTCTKFERGEPGGETGEYRCCGASQVAERVCLPMPGGNGQGSVCGTTGPNGCAVCLLTSANQCSTWTESGKAKLWYDTCG